MTIPTWALKAAAKIRLREEKRRLEILRRLPPHYPEPRKEQECQAWCLLRTWWTPQQIRRFISGYRSEKMEWPGLLDRPGNPSVTEFAKAVGLLAEGEYARTLSETEMVGLLAGKDAAQGAKSRKGSSEGARARKEKTSARDMAMAREFQERVARGGHKSPTAIKTEIASEHGLSRSAGIAAIDRGLRVRK